MRRVALMVLMAAATVAGCKKSKGDCGELTQQAQEALKGERVAEYKAIRNKVWRACQDEAVLKSLDTQLTALQNKPPPAPPPPTFDELLAKTETVPAALKLLGPKLEDETEKLSPGTAFLSVWAANRLKWSELQALPETKRPLVMKDSVAERGKRICTSGMIVEITADRSAGVPIYEGAMTSGPGIVRFVAVGSTGELVERSAARFCGIVTGRYSYSNAGGGVTHAVRAVGMFDLPENKK